MIEHDLYIPQSLDIELPALDKLPVEDGEPMETAWHRDEMILLIHSLKYYWRERSDFYTGGNMFIYFSRQQLKRDDYRGPDFFVVKDVDGTKERESWIAWEENGRLPDMIVELLSLSTMRRDLRQKKDIYERTMRVPEYFCYDPESEQLYGWHLVNARYQPLTPDEQGWLWSDELQLWLGKWRGVYEGTPGLWLRFYDPHKQLVLYRAEGAEAQARHETAARLTAEEQARHEAAARQAAEAEIIALKEELARFKRSIQ